MRRLVITEKNNTAVRIAVILSGGSMQRSYPNRVPVFDFSRDGVDYRVIGLRGHILNLDYPDAMNDWEGTDLRDLVRAEPVKRVVATNIVASLREVCRDIDEIIVATDFDREGELIGTEALEVIAEVRPGLPIKRARYSALTKSEIEGAFGALVEMDYPLALAAASRQVIDLGWGAALTRFISLAANQRGRDFLSVGRVQSPTLALIVDREREIVEFVPKDYWTVHATFEKDGTEFEGRHAHGQFWNEAEANAARDRATGAPTAAVTAYRGEVKEERPPVPYSTTLFLGDATRIGFAAAHAMDVAESLYQSGLISYPRTDNTVYPGSLSLRGILEKLKDTELGREAAEILAQPSIRATRGRTETTDHPPIYPVGAAVKSKLRPDHWRIYELVTRRFLATLAPNAKAHDSGATLDVNGQMFEASGYRVLEPGWRKYFTLYEARESTLPELVQGGSVAVKDVPPPRHDRTRPPNRYSQGALIQEMERLQLGTKSTRHDIIQKLYDRKYVEGKVLQPTETGMAVTEALEIHAEKITQPEMTALLEKDMDEIARGIKEQSAVIRESQDMLVEVIEVLLSKKEEIGKAWEGGGRGELALASPDEEAEVVAWMKGLNKTASLLALEFGLRGGTDITGFGLLGHAREAAEGAGVGLRIRFAAVPFTSAARKFGEAGAFPGGSLDNQEFFSPYVRFAGNLEGWEQTLLFDAQTSGGLLLAVPAPKAAAFAARAAELKQPIWEIGEVLEGEGIEVVK